jgi:predicted small metal-binding protein
MFAGKSLRCDCGYEVRAQDDNALVDAVREHASEAHGIEFSVEEALGVLLRSELETSERAFEDIQASRKEQDA